MWLDCLRLSGVDTNYGRNTKQLITSAWWKSIGESCHWGGTKWQWTVHVCYKQWFLKWMQVRPCEVHLLSRVLKAFTFAFGIKHIRLTNRWLNTRFLTDKILNGDYENDKRQRNLPESQMRAQCESSIECELVAINLFGCVCVFVSSNRQ